MANNNDFTVTLVERWRYLNDQNNPTDGYRITFRIHATNAIDHVVLSLDEMENKDFLRQKIMEKVSNSIDTFNL